MQKNNLIEKLLSEGFRAEVVSAFKKIKREDFIPNEYKKYAYEDIALPIGYGQTISQPFTIAFMLNLLEVSPGQKIMEIGSGSGYVLALLNELSRRGNIIGIEIVPELVERSKKILKNYKNIQVSLAGDQLGFPEEAPFDRILVSAAATKVHHELLEQLADPGILVCPVKDAILKFKKIRSVPRVQGVSRVQGAPRINNKIESEFYDGFRFVPLIE